ncbi:hypothetical protein OB947_04820 [Aeromonas bestiarum]|uniref:hypothetical protein n=1 Tax=Aeromonas bestiarum TaxID=105751 RepID=UPI00259E5E15|nr:hypothetical protein [Aeromonas bestiarum]MDM5088240.1 hypothetical protein [Aeromonas bestiarum]
MKKRIQVLVYSLWGLITLIFGLTAYKEIYEPGMGFWSGTLTVISATLMTLVALLALSWAILSIDRIRNKLLPKPKYKLVNNYSVPCILILIITISNSLGSFASTMQGKELGFLSEVEFSDAKRNKIFDKNEYSKYLVEKNEKYKADEVKRIADKAAKEALLVEKEKVEKTNCLEDALCYATKYGKGGSYICSNTIEKSAKYQFEWTDGILEQKFSSYDWYDKENKLVTLYGNKAKAQNAFGAFKNVIYSCTFNADTGEIVNILIQ